MELVAIGDEVAFSGRLHCLADASLYSTLTGTDMDIDVEGCLVYGTAEDGGAIGYNTGAEALWQAYKENR